jgi:hypothetical protein
VKKIRGIGDTPEGAVGGGIREGAVTLLYHGPPPLIEVQILALPLERFQGAKVKSPKRTTNTKNEELLFLKIYWEGAFEVSFLAVFF